MIRVTLVSCVFDYFFIIFFLSYDKSFKCCFAEQQETKRSVIQLKLVFKTIFS